MSIIMRRNLETERPKFNYLKGSSDGCVSLRDQMPDEGIYEDCHV